MKRLTLNILAGLALAATSAGAAEFETNGITFSDENGGMVITGASGSGSSRDPFVVYEEITGDGVAILTIKGMDEARRADGRVEPQRVRGFTLEKVVTNRTQHPWHYFEMELRELRTRRSHYGDGLSFGQALGRDRGFGADKFAEAYQNDEPIDQLNFYNGTVAPGETVRFRLRITDYSPRWEFFLFQRQDAPLAMIDDPNAVGTTHTNKTANN